MSGQAIAWLLSRIEHAPRRVGVGGQTLEEDIAATWYRPFIAARHLHEAIEEYHTLTAECAALRAEVEKCKEVIANANNSLYGSQGYFLGMGGGFDPHHLSTAIEKIKTQTGEDYAELTTLRAVVERVRNVPVESFRGSCGGFGCDAPDGFMMRVSDILAAMDGGK